MQLDLQRVSVGSLTPSHNAPTETACNTHKQRGECECSKILGQDGATFDLILTTDWASRIAEKLLLPNSAECLFDVTSTHSKVDTTP